MSSLISLQCQLLCACGCSYNINNATGVYTSPAGDPFGPAIGWTTGVPVSIVGGDFNENAALVGKVNLTINNTPTESIVIAFQGTIPPALNIISIVDWLTDLMDEPTTASARIPGLVHSGILEDVNDIFGSIVAAVQNLQNAGSTLPVYVTGHSKGGGMAPVFTALLATGIPFLFAPTAVYTFASPMIGNQDFVDGFPSNIPVYRFENNLDIVPFLAPSSAFISTLEAQAGLSTPELDAIIIAFTTLGGDGEWGYVPLGELNFVNGSSVTNPPANPCANNMAIALAQGSSGLAEVEAAHSHLCNAGYMNGTCNNSGVCPVGNQMKY